MGLKRFLVMAGIASALVITGCGQNVVGPTAPEITNPTTSPTMAAASDAAQPGTTTLATDGQVSASCFGGYGNSKAAKKYKIKIKKNRYKKFLMRMKAHLQRNLCFWRHRFYTFFAGHWIGMYIGDGTLNDLLTSHRLFFKVVLRHHLDRVVMQTAADIVTQTWAPGEGTDPAGYDPEVTLVPFRWRPHAGFYGQMYPGWTAEPSYGTDHYTFQQYNANHDFIGIDTQSFYVDVYKNQHDMVRYQWRYANKIEDGPYMNILIDLSNNIAGNEERFSVELLDIEGNKTLIDFRNSKVDKSAFYRLYRTDHTLELKLTFDETGAGSGFLDILNRRGAMDHYEYVVNAHGWGYWTLNGGRKHKARW